MSSRPGRFAIGVLITTIACLFGCSPPTPDQACRAMVRKFSECRSGKEAPWGDRHVEKCVRDFNASELKDYTRTLKICSELEDCEKAKGCMIDVLVAVGEDAKGKR